MELGTKQNVKKNLPIYHKLLIVENTWLVGGMLMNINHLIVLNVQQLVNHKLTVQQFQLNASQSAAILHNKTHSFAKMLQIVNQQKEDTLGISN